MLMYHKAKALIWTIIDFWWKPTFETEQWPILVIESKVFYHPLFDKQTNIEVNNNQSTRISDDKKYNVFINQLH